MAPSTQMTTPEIALFAGDQMNTTERAYSSAVC